MRFLLVLACLVAACAAGTLPNRVEQRLRELADQNGDIDLFVEPEEGSVEGETRRRTVRLCEWNFLRF